MFASFLTILKFLKFILTSDVVLSLFLSALNKKSVSFLSFINKNLLNCITF